MEVINIPPVQDGLAAGFDVGGTKIHVLDSDRPNPGRYETVDYTDLPTLMTEHFNDIQATPERVVVAMAGPRDDETGEIKMTNSPWPVFSPRQTEETFGIKIATVNDMVATTAGVLAETSVDKELLKPGTVKTTGTRLIVALSTGIGAAAASWDSQSKRFVTLASEAGHMGFQPKDAAEMKFLTYLHNKYPRASVELAISGKHGIDNLVDHYLEQQPSSVVSEAISRARQAERSIGAVLLEYAEASDGAPREFAQEVLQQLGALVGSALRDMTVNFKATGGVYLTGSVALGLGEYLFASTPATNRFIGKGAVHDSLLQEIPIYLVTDPHVAAVGALALARGDS